MKVVGLITEYNPFHNGHKYHLDSARKLTEADFIIVIMSGNFVQRGAPAITDKYTRTKMALSQGADLVIELPACFATASAEYFAYGAVSILESLGIVDTICFGSECGDIEILSKISDLLSKEPKILQALITEYVKLGNSYPTARMKAILKFFKEPENGPLSQVLSCSNNILGIEYLKALKRLNSKITPYTLQRKDTGYHDSILNANTINSATAIRKSYFDTEDMITLKNSVPPEVHGILCQYEKKRFPIYDNDFSNLLYIQILQKDYNELIKFFDISKDLAKRIQNNIYAYKNFNDFSMLLKTKQYTLTRINRALIHILLGLKKTPSLQQPVPYIRILGLRKGSSFILNRKTARNTIPIITKVADARNALSTSAMAMLEQDILAANLYNRIIYSKYGYSVPNEYQHGIIVSN